jgi:hypothetical protein
MIDLQLELPGFSERELYPSATATATSFVADSRDAGLSMSSSKLINAPDDLAEFTAEFERSKSLLPSRVNVDPEQVERGLSTLVLTVIELLRQLMERQALRRMEAGTIDDEQIERLGVAFIKLEQRMEELKIIFGLRDEDLNLDLGPLGKLM